MRNLTITRKKSFVGCLMKDQVYIRDEAAQELIIDGVPCRKIGDIKNGESKTFQIEDGEQQIFIIVDKVSKDYCNASVTVPEGQEEVSLSGVHKFIFGSNPFVFDGVVPTEEQLVKQKKNNRKGAIITTCAIIVGFAIGLFLPSGFLNSNTPEPKIFQTADFQITLTDAFEAQEQEGFTAFYASKTAMVFAVRDDKSLFDDITLNDYCDLVLEVNGKTGSKMNTKDDFQWFEYTAIPDGEEFYYLVVCCESEDAFWIVNFATPVSNSSQYKTAFLDWAGTIEVGTQ